jgi:C4-dicarboxylate-specific signal transduction histidine kinase
MHELHGVVRQFYGESAGADMCLNCNQLKKVLATLGTPPLGKRGVSVNVRISGFGPRFTIPQALLRVLVLPLVNNSIEALEAQKSGPRRRILRVSCSQIREEHVLRLVVADNGPGWPWDVSDLETAIREGRRLSTKGRNRGHGLQNVRRLITRLKGHMRFSRSPEGGAWVELLVPWRT